MSEWFETFRGIAHPWLCDAYGHLNTRHHMAMFDDASSHFLHRLSALAPVPEGSRLGWADVSLKATLSDEVPLGRLVVLRTRLLRLGRSSVTYHTEMRSADDGRLHSAVETVTVRFDLDARRAVPLPEAMVAAASAWIATEG